MQIGVLPGCDGLTGLIEELGEHVEVRVHTGCWYVHKACRVPDSYTMNPRTKAGTARAYASAQRGETHTDAYRRKGRKESALCQEVLTASPRPGSTLPRATHRRTRVNEPGLHQQTPEKAGKWRECGSRKHTSVEPT